MSDGSTSSERLRIPAPVLRRRVASGRGATEQPNVPADEPARLTPTFWVMVLLTGVGAGLFGALLMFILTSVEHLAFGFDSGTFESGAEHASLTRRIVSTGIAGVVAGVGWFLLRRYTRGQKAEVDDALWNGDGHLSFRRSAGTSVLSEVVVGMGASVGREAAPKLMGGVAGSLLARWTGMTEAQRRLLVASGAGAGFSAVYNVPLGGAVLAAEVLYGSVALPVIMPALACSAIATVTAWLYLPAEVTYPGIPAYPFSFAELVWSLLVAVPIALLAVGYVRLIAWVSHHRSTGWKSIVAPIGAMLLVGAAGLAFPQLFGNGKSIAQLAFLGQGGLVLLLVLAVLKPILTAACIGSGISGGLFTPTLSMGAALGGFLGGAWSLLWPGTPAGAYAVIGAAALISAAMQAPLAGLALVLDLTHSNFSLMVPMVLAAVVATAVARHLDGYSIYSGRLPTADR